MKFHTLILASTLWGWESQAKVRLKYHAGGQC